MEISKWSQAIQPRVSAMIELSTRRAYVFAECWLLLFAANVYMQMRLFIRISDMHLVLEAGSLLTNLINLLALIVMISVFTRTYLRGLIWTTVALSCSLGVLGLRFDQPGAMALTRTNLDWIAIGFAVLGSVELFLWHRRQTSNQLVATN